MVNHFETLAISGSSLKPGPDRQERSHAGRYTPQTPRSVSLISPSVALARAEMERCVMCQVRLRPMVYNEVRRNEAIVQCDSCQRILYYVPPSPADAAMPPAAPGSSTPAS